MVEPDPAKSEIVLCVPGKWRDRTELVTAVAQSSDGYLFAGMLIMHIATREAAKLVVREHDERLRIVFARAGRHWATAKDLENIEAHSCVLYLLIKGGSLDNARRAMDFGNGLLKAGGMAVHIETAGVTHSPAEWLKMSERKTAWDLLRAFVVVATGEETTYSCGMHNFGLRDAVVTSKLSSDEAAQLVNRFILYVLEESPTLNENEMFSVSKDAPRYRLSAEPCTKFAPNSPFHNPCGMWRLTPLGGRPTGQEA